MKRGFYARLALLIILCALTALLPAIAVIAARNVSSFPTRINECIGSGYKVCR